MGDGIVYDEEWDETAELLISDEIKESEVDKSGIGGVRKAVRWERVRCKGVRWERVRWKGLR